MIVTAVYWVEHGLAIRQNVALPDGVTYSGGSLGREADCKEKANITCNDIWYFYGRPACSPFSSGLTKKVKVVGEIAVVRQPVRITRSAGIGYFQF